jgi:hypothetical protein
MWRAESTSIRCTARRCRRAARRWDGPIEDAVALLGDHDLPIVEGPSFRLSTDGSKGTAVYFPDPDDNLVELLTTG